MNKIAWLFAPRPKLVTEFWEWPMAYYDGPERKHAAYILCDQPYSERIAATVLPLNVIILRYNQGLTPRRMLVTNTHFNRLEILMAYTISFLENNRSWQPLLI